MMKEKITVMKNPVVDACGGAVRAIVDYSRLSDGEVIAAWMYAKALYAKERVSRDHSVEYCMAAILWRSAEAERLRRGLDRERYPGIAGLLLEPDDGGDAAPAGGGGLTDD